MWFFFIVINFKIWVCNENMCLFIHMVLSVKIIIKYKGIIEIKIFLGQNLLYDSFWHNKV